jgi:ABC-type multidrug transport system fused ATPase/permease subunit
VQQFPSETMQPVASFILQEIKGQFLASIPHLVVMLVALTLQSFMIPIGSAKILDDAGDDLTERIKYLAAYQLLAVACNALQRRLSEGRAHAQRSKLQAQGYERVLRLDDRALDDAKVGELVQTLRDPGAAWLACEFPAAALNALVKLVGGAWAMRRADAHLAVVGLASAPLLFLVQKARSKLARRATRKTQALEADALARVSEALGLRSTVRAHGAEPLEARQFQGAVDKVIKQHTKTLRKDVRLSAGAEIVVAAGELALLMAAAKRRASGGLGLGAYAAFRAALLQYQRGLRETTKAANKAARGVGAAERYVALVNGSSVILDGVGREPSQGAAPSIEFEDVVFAYDAKAPRPVLQGLKLIMEPGATTALVGPSGSGKSTVARLLLRLRDPAGGRVLVDGVDVKYLDALAHRRRIGVVPQEPQLFNRSVAENVAYGMEPAPSQELIEAACVKAGVDSVISKLPEGYATRCGERETRLSGGEKQRVALARALVRDPRILLLDEATSALDAATERRVQAALDAAAAGRTTLVVAHRLATVRSADAIVVLDEGRVIERGTHAQLMKKKGAYAALVAAQTDVRTVERTVPAPPIVLLSNMSSDDEEDCVW